MQESGAKKSSGSNAVKTAGQHTKMCSYARGLATNMQRMHVHLVLGRRVTAFASQGLWIRINCDQHAVDCGARWVALAEGPTPETQRWYLKEDAAAAPRCVRKGCRNTSADKPKEMTMRWDVHARLWGGLGWMSERS